MTHRKVINVPNPELAFYWAAKAILQICKGSNGFSTQERRKTRLPLIRYSEQVLKPLLKRLLQANSSE